MIEINNKENCCGCTACYNICPKSAIKMVPDKEGFLYPVIDKKKCINCNLCKKVCPILSKSDNMTSDLSSYIIQSKDNIILSNATSGGFFIPLANYVLNNGGIVIGVGYDNKLKIKHLIIDNNNKNDLYKLSGSKYIQSELGDIFKIIKEKLISGIEVLFSGTPCQVEGLLSFLQKKYNNLITVDVVCHGTPSPKLWEEYKEFQEKKYKSKITKFNFRNKTYGYHSGTMKLEFLNKKTYYGSARVDLMLKSFFSEISSRPSCYSCHFKKEHHNSDFTIFDCWHAHSLNSSIIDKDKGFTNLFVNTKNGKNIFHKIKNSYIYYNSDYKKAIELDGSMVNKSAIKHVNRDEFYIYLCDHNLEKTVKTFIPITNIDKFIEKVKKPLYRLKLFKIIKRKKL